jgi:IclR family transcriptional regulator, acetate operon repressor
MRRKVDGETEEASSAAGRVLSMLVTLGARHEGLTVTELAKECECSVPTASRQMGLLLKFGLARLDPMTRRYQLGLRVFELGQNMQFEKTVRQAAAPILAKLASGTNCLASLDALENGDVVTLEVQEAISPIQVRLPIGFRAPAFSTASGRAALSLLDDKQIEAVRLRVKPPISTIDFNVFKDIRSNGYAFNDAEAEPFINAIGVALNVLPGSLPLAISLAAPSFIIDRNALLDYVPMLKGAAEKVVTEILKQTA